MKADEIKLGETTYQHLGQTRLGHTYLAATPDAITEWPDCVEKIREQLPPHGLRTRLAAESRVFSAGASIPVTLEVENTGDEVRDYFVPSVSSHESLLRVINEHGEVVPYLGRLFQFQEKATRLEPRQTSQLASFDLSESYYLRRPGRYTVRYNGAPPSAPFEFEVTENQVLAGADGDPVGRLLPLVKERWWLGASSSRTTAQPGRNWSEITGRGLTFVFNPPSTNKDAGHVWLWLAEQPAKALPPDDLSSKPEFESLGKVSWWHVYFLASEIALKEWPTAKEDILQSLATASDTVSDAEPPKNTPQGFLGNEKISPRIGLEFLKPYPKLHGLSLDMTEQQFLEIAKQQDLKPQKSFDSDKPRYEIGTGDGHIVIVMFGNNGEKCNGIQRVRDELTPRAPATGPTDSKPEGTRSNDSSATGGSS